MDILRFNSLTLLLLYLCSQVSGQQCAKPCQCPSSVPTCPTGVPTIWDECECCQICARQKGETCSSTLVCDRLQGLECDFSASFPGEPGECVGQDELGCQLNGKTYKEGEVFQPSCAVRCKCSGGGISCVPNCGLTGLRPSPECPHPRRVLLPGKCCKEWVCENLDNILPQNPPTVHQPSHPLYHVGSGVNCIDQSTEWTACSRSCGEGISTRMSNQNPACRIEQQTRLCTVRPCQSARHMMPTPPRRCKTSYKSSAPTHLHHRGCYSTQIYRPRYCGLCTDGRCCTPHQTHTIKVTFRCPGGLLRHQPVMVVRSCVCHNNCPSSSAGTYWRSAS